MHQNGPILSKISLKSALKQNLSTKQKCATVDECEQFQLNSVWKLGTF